MALGKKVICFIRCCQKDFVEYKYRKIYKKSN